MEYIIVQNFPWPLWMFHIKNKKSGTTFSPQKKITAPKSRFPFSPHPKHPKPDPLNGTFLPSAPPAEGPALGAAASINQPARGTPKWMVKITENPINPWMIWGDFPHYFRKHPYMSSQASISQVRRWLLLSGKGYIMSVFGWLFDGYSPLLVRDSKSIANAMGAEFSWFHGKSSVDIFGSKIVRSRSFKCETSMPGPKL